MDGCLVLFGGFSTVTGGALNDTWEFSGNRWTKVLGPAPTPSEEMTMDFDASGGYVLLAEPWPSNQYWAFESGTWHQLHFSTPYPNLLEALMGYDEGDGYSVMFGGLNSSGTYENSTWALSHGSWYLLPTKLGPPPLAYVEEETQYDESDHYLVLFGGVFANGTLSNSTWVWGAPEFAISISISPPVGGSVEINYLEYANLAVAWLPLGAFPIAPHPSVGYALANLTSQGAVTLSPSGTVIVGPGGGAIAARLVASATILFTVVPPACGPLSFNGTTFGSGSSGAFPPTTPSGSAPPYRLTAPSCSCYQFSDWLFTGGLVLASSSSSSTTVNVNAGGNLTANYGATTCASVGTTDDTWYLLGLIVGVAAVVVAVSLVRRGRAKPRSPSIAEPALK